MCNSLLQQRMSATSLVFLMFGRSMSKSTKKKIVWIEWVIKYRIMSVCTVLYAEVKGGWTSYIKTNKKFSQWKLDIDNIKYYEFMIIIPTYAHDQAYQFVYKW